jgi:hypothetical protein
MGIFLEKSILLSFLSSFDSTEHYFVSYLVWRPMLKVRELVEENMRWFVGEGNMDVWWDDWSGEGRLADRFPNTIHDPMPVKALFDDADQWNATALQLWSDLVSKAYTKTCSIGWQTRQVWKFTNNGNLSTAEAWELVRTKINRVAHLFNLE